MSALDRSPARQAQAAPVLCSALKALPQAVAGVDGHRERARKLQRHAGLRLPHSAVWQRRLVLHHGAAVRMLRAASGCLSWPKEALPCDAPLERWRAMQLSMNVSELNRSTACPAKLQRSAQACMRTPS